MSDGRRWNRTLAPWVAFTLTAVLLGTLLVPNHISSPPPPEDRTWLELELRRDEARVLRVDDPTGWRQTMLAQIRSALDAWGNPLRARVRDDGRFEIASAGADEELDTADDLVVLVEGRQARFDGRRVR